MKVKTKLVLSKETLKRLAKPQLEQVAGGDETILGPECVPLFQSTNLPLCGGCDG